MTDTAPRSPRQVFDEWARTGRADSMEVSHGPAARAGFDALRVEAGARYLDIGCGNGYTVRWAADAGADAVGLDESPEMIALAVERSRGIARAGFVCSPFPDRVFEPGSFDVIFSMEVFYYLPDLDAGLRRVVELLSPGGRFACVVDYYAENTATHDWPRQLGVAMHLLSERGWRLRFERAGLDVVLQKRIRRPPGSACDEWKIRQGSLLTLGARG